MSTHIDTVEFILEKLGDKRFSTRAMFGEYALYAEGKVVGLICDDQLYVKILPAPSLASDGARISELEGICEKDEAYPGSKKYYVVPARNAFSIADAGGEEGMLSTLRHLPEILLDIAKALPVPKKKKVRN